MKRLTAIVWFSILIGVAWAGGESRSLTCTSGTCTVAIEHFGETGELVRMDLDWLSDASGNVVTNDDDFWVIGEIMGIATNPDDSATSPTDNYDITLTDLDGLDLMAGGGANRSASTSQAFCPALSTYYKYIGMTAATLTISTAGNSRGGIVRLYLRR